jgi:hypothetical protein
VYRARDPVLDREVALNAPDVGTPSSETRKARENRQAEGGKPPK